MRRCVKYKKWRLNHDAGSWRVQTTGSFHTAIAPWLISTWQRGENEALTMRDNQAGDRRLAL